MFVAIWTVKHSSYRISWIVYVEFTYLF